MNDALLDEEVVRAKKLEEYTKLGINPYPSIVAVKTDIVDAKDSIDKVFNVAGRIVSKRPHGKIAFVDIIDDTGRIQLFFSIAELNDISKEVFQLLDLGDFIEAHGSIFVTKAGENTLRVDSFNIISKSILPYPKEFFGVKDTELRYRKRFVDFNLNPRAKETIRTRSVTITAIRDFMNGHGFIEVETPILQEIPGGAAAKPFITHYNTLEHDFYLRIATELHLKRMIVGGFEKVYEIGRIFRNEGLSHMHNPEFTSMEFYWAYRDYKFLMKFTEELIESVVKTVKGSANVEYQGKNIDFTAPYPVIKFADLIKKDTGIDINKEDTFEKLTLAINKAKIKLDSADAKVWEKLTDELYKKTSRPKIIDPIFVINQPIEMTPLAKRDEDNPREAQRFQLVCGGGLEILNAYTELNDPIEQEKCLKDQVKLRDAGWEEGQMMDENFVEALAFGMPPTAGWGIGIDRFVMLLTDEYSIKEVIAFPTLKPEK